MRSEIQGTQNAKKPPLGLRPHYIFLEELIGYLYQCIRNPETPTRVITYSKLASVFENELFIDISKERIYEIKAAMFRYMEASKPIPEEWLKEYAAVYEIVYQEPIKNQVEFPINGGGAIIFESPNIGSWEVKAKNISEIGKS